MIFIRCGIIAARIRSKMYAASARKNWKNTQTSGKQQEADRLRNLSALEIKSDLILINGARLYNDHAHPEYSTAECRSLFQLVAHDKGGERILQRCAERRSQRLGKRVILYKNNTDFHGHSYGCHDNYLMRRDIPFEYLKESIMPFFDYEADFCGGREGRHRNRVGSKFGWFFSARHNAPIFFMLKQALTQCTTAQL